MYLGSVVEMADKKDLYANPTHPYTRALLSAIPIPDPTKIKEMVPIMGEIPSNVNTPPGCKFHTRCPYAKDICKVEIPPAKEVGKRHYAACHFAGEI
jgi:peptide/nickel transport system ATP-binding protein/oligopeptide transport system ATP-binding protein